MMITEQLINYADRNVRLLCAENIRLRLWVYVLPGISNEFVFMLIYFIYDGKFNLYKWVKY
jgi:hypothetical protein